MRDPAEERKARLIREATDQLTKDLVDKGRLIEAGFAAMLTAAGLVTAPPHQIELMREAFFAGAQHLWGSVMSFLDAGQEVTDKDLERMDAIQKELQAFIDDFSKRHGLPPRERGHHG